MPRHKSVKDEDRVKVDFYMRLDHAEEKYAYEQLQRLKVESKLSDFMRDLVLAAFPMQDSQANNDRVTGEQRPTSNDRVTPIAQTSPVHSYARPFSKAAQVGKREARPKHDETDTIDPA